MKYATGSQPQWRQAQTMLDTLFGPLISFFKFLSLFFFFTYNHHHTSQMQPPQSKMWCHERTHRRIETRSWSPIGKFFIYTILTFLVTSLLGFFHFKLHKRVSQLSMSSLLNEKKKKKSRRRWVFFFCYSLCFLLLMSIS